MLNQFHFVASFETKFRASDWFLLLESLLLISLLFICGNSVKCSFLALEHVIGPGGNKKTPWFISLLFKEVRKKN